MFEALFGIRCGSCGRRTRDPVIAPSGARMVCKNCFVELRQAENRRQAAAEAKRLADEVTAKRRAEEVEAKRRADEAETKRRAEEAEAKRLADEAETKRRVEEAEAKRLADEAKAKRRAEAKAKRLAEKAETNRLVGRAFEAIERGDVEELNSLLEATPGLVLATDGDNRTLLHLAAETDHKPAVELLLAKGAAVNAQAKNGAIPLHRAKTGEVAELLLAKGANVDAKGWDDCSTPLADAAYLGREDVVEVLLANKANVDAKTGYFGRTALHRAAQGGHKHVAELLLQSGATVNARGTGGETPFHVVTDPSVAELLLAKGATANAKDDNGRVPLHWAANTRMVEFLVATGADIGARSNSGNTPSQLAAMNGNRDVEALLLRLGGAKILDTRIHDAIEKGDLARAKSLIDDEPALVSLHRHDNGFTPLHMAARHGHTSFVQLLLASGAPIDAVTHAGHTPLHHAVANNKRDVIILLIEHGANVNAKARDGSMPLGMAIIDDEMALAKDLIELGARLDVKELHRKRDKGNSFSVSLVSDWTLLHHVAGLHAAGSIFVAEFLISQGADVNAADARGGTPLQWATNGTYNTLRNQEIGAQMLKLLIANGADPDRQDYNGRSAVALAEAGQGNGWALPVLKAGARGQLPQEQKRRMEEAEVKRRAEEAEAKRRAEEVDDQRKVEAKPRAEQLYNLTMDDLLAAAGVTETTAGSAFTIDARTLEEVAEDDINQPIQTRIGYTALHLAAMGLPSAISKILKFKPDVNAHTFQTRFTPLHMAVTADNPTAITALILGGADINSTNSWGVTPLQLAAMRGKLKALAALISGGADVSFVEEHDGASALHAAAFHGQSEAIDILLAAGADLHLSDKRGNTPLAIARDRFPTLYDRLSGT